MNARRILLISIILWIVGTLFVWLTRMWLFGWVYTIAPIIWLSPEEVTSTNNMVVANVMGFFSSVIFVAVYAFLYKGIPGKGVEKGIKYGLIVWLVGALVGIAPMPLYMTIAPTVVIYWIVQALVLDVIKGAIVGAMYKRKQK